MTGKEKKVTIYTILQIDLNPSTIILLSPLQQILEIPQ